MTGLTRRETLAALGSVGVGTLAGCTREEPSFWDDPPNFDATDLGDATAEPVPDRASLLPVVLDGSVVDSFTDRVTRLLEPIPDPLSRDRLPNGAFRSHIETRRDDARETLDAAAEQTPALTGAETLADARGYAADAVGTWAAVTTGGDPGAVTQPVSRVRRDAEQLADDLPDLAADPQEGVVVYGAFQRPLDVAIRSDLGPSPSTVASAADPLRTGDVVGTVERVVAQSEAIQHLRDRYVEQLDEPTPVDGELAAAVETLGPMLEDRLLEPHDAEPRYPTDPPRRGAFINDTDLPRDAPSVRLLRRRRNEFYRELRFDPTPTREYIPDRTATALRRAYLTLVHLETFEEVGERINGDDEMFPATGEAVSETRSTAMGDLRRLLAAQSPLENWLGNRLRDIVHEGDAELEGSDDPRAAATAYTDYQWVSIAAAVAPDVTETFHEILA
ncbi:MAG: hypothetical protein PPP55_10405 [Halorubrum sp.]